MSADLTIGSITRVTVGSGEVRLGARSKGLVSVIVPAPGGERQPFRCHARSGAELTMTATILVQQNSLLRIDVAAAR